MLNFKNISLRIRIFLSMILLVLLASVLIFGVTIYQYDEQTKDYNIQRFDRKEESTLKSIAIELNSRTTYPVKTENLAKIFQERIYQIYAVHNLHLSIYDLEGNLLRSSIESAFEKIDKTPLSSELLTELANNSSNRIIDVTSDNNISYQSSYSYITDAKFKRIGVLQLQFSQDNSEVEYELYEFLVRLSFVYLLMFVVAIVFAYFLSSYITRSIKNISDKMKETRLNKRNEKIILNGASIEIDMLVASYNNMIDDLEESAIKLAKSEREQAWREMAKQVAHEIKNPLTPMRLSVQSFERKFDAKDPKIKEKLAEFSQTLIQQIDVMSFIASAFSDFAKMPSQNREELEVVSIIKLAIEIFNEEYIYYRPNEEKIFANLDKTQLIRIVTNLVKNATQAVEKEENKWIEVLVSSQKNEIKMTVSDNGKGIAKELENLIFEPKFTTKSSGMGLGLPMVKNIIEAYDGSISFVSKEGQGTIFTVILPKK